MVKRGETSLDTITRTKGALDELRGPRQPGHLRHGGSRRQGVQAVACAEPHAWRAVSVIELAEDARYLAGRAAQKVSDDACKAEAQQRATDPWRSSGRYQWPKEDAFNEGQRYGLCWVPEKSDGVAS